jgi:hypothetical protein
VPTLPIETGAARLENTLLGLEGLDVGGDGIPIGIVGRGVFGLALACFACEKELDGSFDDSNC